jgi:regulator of sigma E protease
MESLKYVYAFLLVLIPLVVFHELGHFLMCKLAGVRVTEFAIGFGRKLFSFRFKGTEYRWNLLPLGGYVDFMGEAVWRERVPTEADHFYNQSKFIRVLVLLMGPLFNFLLAFLLFWLIFARPIQRFTYFQDGMVLGWVEPGSAEESAGLKVGDRLLALNGKDQKDPDRLIHELVLLPGKTVTLSLERDGARRELSYTVPTDPKEGAGNPDFWPAIRLLVTEVLPGSPAEAAGLQAGDIVSSLDGAPVFFVNREGINPLAQLLNDGRSGPIRLGLLRNDQPLTVDLTPRFDEQAGRLVLGMHLFGEHQLVDRSLLESGAVAWDETLHYSTLIFRYLGKMLQGAISPKSLSSVPTIGKQAGETIEEGWRPFLFLIAILSVNLAIFNLLPIPMLDGGEIFVILVEWIGRRDFDLNTKFRVKQLGFLLLACTMAAVLVSDIFKIIN